MSAMSVRVALARPYLLRSYGTQSWMLKLRLVVHSCAIKTMPIVSSITKFLSNH